jgi:hypothetical protein
MPLKSPTKRPQTPTHTPNQQNPTQWWVEQHATLLPRMAFEAGSMFEAAALPAPPPGDRRVAYCLSDVLHDCAWGGEVTGQGGLSRDLACHGCQGLVLCSTVCAARRAAFFQPLLQQGLGWRDPKG